MFRILFFSLSLFLVCLGAVLYFSIFREIDPAAYQKLSQENLLLRSHDPLSKFPLHQEAQEVQKDLWTVRDGKRIHATMKNHRSRLTLTKQKGKVKGAEQLSEIESTIYEDEKEVRRFLASRGTCSFPSCHMILQGSSGKNVLFWQEGLKLSAPEIHIYDGVQGFGDIRFFFNADEEF